MAHSSAPNDERAWHDRFERLRRLGAASVTELTQLLDEPNWALRRRVVAELATLGDAALPALCAILRDERADEAKNAATMDALTASVGNATDLLVELTAHPVAAVAADAAQVLGRRRERGALRALAKLATGPDDNVAVAAVEALGRIGGRGAVETLIALVRSGNFFRTFPAIDVLGRSADPRAIAPLASLLQDSRYALEAIRALSRTADRAAVAPLASVLAHASPMHVRVAAAALVGLADVYEQRYGDSYVISAALAQAAPTGALRALNAALAGADSDERKNIARVVGMLQNADGVPLLSALVDGPESVAQSAILALDALGPRVTTQLLSLLRNSDSARRAMVLPLITSSMDAVPDTERCLLDPDGQVRALAAQTLARIGSVASVGLLFPLLQDPNTRVVQAAVAAIQSLGSPETERLTLQAARSSDPRVQREALRIVRAFGYKSALETALSLIDTEDERLREAAIMALSLIEDPLAEQAMVQQAGASDDKTRAMGVRALGLAQKSDQSVAALTRACSDPDAWVRYYAVQALGRLRATEALSTLRNLLNDVAPQVRVSAIEALSHLPCEDAFGALEAAARSTDPDLRRAAVLGFGELGRESAVPILLDAVQSDDAATRLVAVSALGHFDTALAVSGLGQAANDDDEGVRLTAIGLLSQLRSHEATQALIGLLPAYRSQDRVLLALSAASPGRVEGISEGLVDADDEEAAVLASALVRMRTPQALNALISGLSLPNAAARKAIVTGLGALASPEALDALRRTAREDADPEVRRISALAATQI